MSRCLQWVGKESQLGVREAWLSQQLDSILQLSLLRIPSVIPTVKTCDILTTKW